MRWTIFAEISGPFEWRPRVERVHALRRYHWLWFSWGTIKGDFNDMLRAIEACAEEHNTNKGGQAMGWPTDADIERNRINQAERDIAAMEQMMCRFCGGSGTFDDDPKVPGPVTECTWCNGTGDSPTKSTS